MHFAMLDAVALPPESLSQEKRLIVKISSKRQITFPAQVLDALGVGPGDQLELEESPDSLILRPRRIDYSKLGFLKDKIDPTVEPFDIEKFRSETYDPSLRD